MPENFMKMSESQNHGFEFERWIKLNKIKDIYLSFFDAIKYTNDWDIPPVSIKSFKYKGENPTIEFGSIERNFKNESDYILVLIGYEQVGNIKYPVFSDVLFIQNKQINKLKGKLDLNIIKNLSLELKSFKKGYHTEARTWALEKKSIHNKQTVYDIRFKIDSKTQRRIQCALKLKDIYATTNQELVKTNKLNVPEIISNTRKRKTL